MFVFSPLEEEGTHHARPYTEAPASIRKRELGEDVGKSLHCGFRGKGKTGQGEN